MDNKFEILRCERNIDNIERKIRNLEKKIDDIDAAKKKLNDNLNLLYSIRKNALRDVDRAGSRSPELYVVKRVARNAKDVINGPKYAAAMNTIEDRKEKLSRKRKSIIEEIEDLEAEIRNINSDISKLKKKKD